MDNTPEQYSGKYVTFYMVYCISPDRKVGRSAAYDSQEAAEKMVVLIHGLGWSGTWCKQTYEVDD